MLSTKNTLYNTYILYFPNQLIIQNKFQHVKEKKSIVSLYLRNFSLKLYFLSIKRELALVILFLHLSPEL